MPASARELGDRPSSRDVNVDLAKCAGQRGIGKPREQPLLLCGRGRGPTTEGLDEQHLNQALQDQIAAGTVARRLPPRSARYDATQASGFRLVAPDVDDRRQEPHQQLRVRALELEVSPEHPHRRRARPGAVANLTRLAWARRPSASARDRSASVKAGVSGRRDEVALLELRAHRHRRHRGSTTPRASRQKAGSS